MLDGRTYEEALLRDWLALERIPRVGPLTVAKLIAAFGSPCVALQADAGEIRKRTALSEGLAQSIANFTPPETEITRDIGILEKLSAALVTRWDEDYPTNLREIYDPPAMLFMRGTMIPEDSRAIALVGTRNPTRYGLDVAQQITRDLVRAGVTIISGLARGIDTACHKAALKEGGRTIGVLGCGIDVVYPRENRELTDEIAKSGAVISEFRPQTPPLATNFYRRNRIVSGLAKGVVVIEAAKNSGSLITSAHALEQNRDVLAVPGNIMSKRSEGPHYLIKQGAGLAESGEDILNSVFRSATETVQASLFEVRDEASEVSDSAREVLEALDLDPVPIDALCESLHMQAGKLSGILLELELQGLIRQYPGKMFSRILG
jgi:DNA processing protein